MKLGKLVKKQILEVKLYKPGKPIEEVKREFNIKKIIKLASNENPLGPSNKALESIKKNCERINRYPESTCYYLRKKLAAQMDKKFTLDNFIIGNGSNEIIELVLRAFLNPGERVISCFPTFLIYKIASSVAGADYVEVPLDKNLKYDLSAIKRKITKNTKVIFISNPNNPTGTYILKKELVEFFKKVPDHVIIVVDEAYNEFVDIDEEITLYEYIYKKPIVIMRTFSKAYGLSGLRIGYGIAIKKCIDYLNRVRQPFNVNMLAQEAALAALKDDKHIQKVKNLISDQKMYMYSELEKLNLKFIKSQTNFILIDVEKNSYKIYNNMLKHGIIVRPMNEYNLNNFIRVTIGTTEENKKFIKLLSKFIK